MEIFAKNLFSRKVHLITGGGSGIGQAIACALAEHGAHIAVLGRRQEALADTVRKIADLGYGEALALSADVREPEAVEQAIRQVLERWGRLDGVVNAAAGNFPCLAEKMTPNGFRSVVDIDLMGTFYVCKYAFPALKETKDASIVNISATLHYGGTPWQSHVSAAKAGIDALTRNLAVEWGACGIRVNGIAPGPIDHTEGMRRLVPAAQRAQMEKDIPVRRFGLPEDIARAVLFLSSPAASFINGTILVVDGGRSLNFKLLENAAVTAAAKT
jgi:peroxisomal 2,4-dienoyl-CoA reductase